MGGKTLLERFRDFKLTFFIVPVLSLFLMSCGTDTIGNNSGNTGGETGSSTSGNNSGSTGGETGGGTGATPTYLAYQGSVYLVDPANPTSPIQISGKPTLDGFTSLALSYNSTDKSYTDLHPHELFWIEESDGDASTRNGGPLMKVSMVKGNSTPTPVQLSNHTDFCLIYSLYEGLVGKKSYLILETAGSDGVCNTLDDERYFAHSDMTSADNPIPLNSMAIITSIDGGLSGTGISGFLVYYPFTNQIQKCDLNLSNCTTVGNGTNVSFFAYNFNNGNVYLCVNNNLMVFNGSSLSSTGANCDPSWSRGSDDQAIYAVNNGNILKFQYGGSNWTTIYNGSDASWIEDLTGNYLIFGTTNGFKAVSKNGGNPIDIYTSGLGEDLRFRFSTWDKSFFNVINNNGTVKACIWSEGGSTNCENNNYWAGVSFSVNGTVDVRTVEDPLPIYKILKVEGASNGGGGTLYAVDPSNLSSKTNLGTVPANFNLSGYGIGDNMLLMGEDSRGTPYPLGNQRDIFFVNLSQQNSLQNITNTSNKSESPF